MTSWRDACVSAADVWYRGCNDSCAWLASQVLILGSKPDCYEMSCRSDECNSAPVLQPSTTSAPPTRRPDEQTTKSSATSTLLGTVVTTLLVTAVVITRLM